LHCYCVTNTNHKYDFSDGKIIDEVLKQRLENKVIKEWSKEINTMVMIKPDVILDKDPAASPVQCMC